MKTTFFLIAFGLGMALAVMTYLAGGVFLMATGLAFSVVIFGCLFVIASQLHQVLVPENTSDDTFALPA